MQGVHRPLRGSLDLGIYESGSKVLNLSKVALEAMLIRPLLLMDPETLNGRLNFLLTYLGTSILATAGGEAIESVVQSRSPDAWLPGTSQMDDYESV